MKPKIAFITPALGLGGAERWILTLTKYFKNVNVEKIINLTGKSDRNLLNEACKYTNVLVDDFFTKKDLLKKELEKIDVVISWGYTASLNLSTELNCLSVDVSHSDPSWSNHKNLTSITEKKSKYHVAVSKTAASSFSDYIKPKVIYNGIDLERIKPNISREEQRKIWDVENKKVVFFSGRLSDEKNPFALIDAIKYFNDDWVFVFISNGQLSEKIKTLNNNKIKLVDKTQHIGNYFIASDIFVMTSNVEGMPLSLLEAWASNIPVVTTEYNSYLELKTIHGDISNSLPINSDSILLSETIKEAYKKGKDDYKVKYANQILNSFYTADIMVKNWENYIFSLLNNE